MLVLYLYVGCFVCRKQRPIPYECPAKAPPAGPAGSVVLHYHEVVSLHQQAAMQPFSPTPLVCSGRCRRPYTEMDDVAAIRMFTPPRMQQRRWHRDAVTTPVIITSGTTVRILRDDRRNAWIVELSHLGQNRRSPFGTVDSPEPCRREPSISQTVKSHKQILY